MDAAERYRRAKEIFLDVVDLEAPAAARALEDACAGDTELKAEVELLLDLDGGATPLDVRPLARPGEELGPGGQVDGERSYRILEEIGRGGMGRVFLAERSDGDFVQRVALKVLMAPLAGSDVIRRFRRERRILAQLDHRNIATLIDGGQLPDGSPFLAMEHVEGRQIDAYCREEELSVEARVELVLKVCAAVDSAHRALVVHRDLKPSNVLVDAEGEPKLLDFGIAKLLEDSPLDPSLATQEGMQPLTPRYASPEQVRGEAVTTATDVYSLGVVLYELLTGVLPFDLEGTSPLVWIRAICDEEPRAPSTAAATGLRRTVQDVRSPVVGGLPSDVVQRLRGDLDAILLKALRKRPEDRYGSVRELAEDLQRHLEGRPVLARRQTLGYQLGRWVRRNRWAVLALLAIFGALGLWIRSEIEGRSRARLAQRFARQAQSIEATMRYAHLLPVHDLRPVRRRIEAEMTAIETSMAQLGDLAQGPGHQALGRGALALGDLPRARRHLETAMEIVGEDDADVAYALSLCLVRQFADAWEDVLRTADPVKREELRAKVEQDFKEPALRYLEVAQHAENETPEYLQALVAFIEERHEDARALARVAAARTPWLYEADLLVAESLAAEAHGHHFQVGYDEAEQLFVQAQEALRAGLRKGESEPRGWARLCEAGTFILESQINYEKRLDTESLERARADCRTSLELDPENTEVLSLLAMTYFREGEYRVSQGEDPSDALAQHEELGRRAMDLDPTDSQAAGTTSLGIYVRARWHGTQGELEKADELLEEAIRLARRTTELAPGRLMGYNSLGIYCRLGVLLRLEQGRDPDPSFACSRTALEEAVRIEPGFLYGQNNLASLQLLEAGVHIARGVDPSEILARGRQASEAAVAINAEYAEPIATLCQLLLREAEVAVLSGRDPESSIESGLVACDETGAFEAKASQAAQWTFELHLEKARWRLSVGPAIGGGGLVGREVLDEVLAPARSALEAWARAVGDDAPGVRRGRRDLDLLVAEATLQRGAEPTRALARARRVAQRLVDGEDADYVDRLALARILLFGVDAAWRDAGLAGEIREQAKEAFESWAKPGEALALFEIAALLEGDEAAVERLGQLLEERPLLRRRYARFAVAAPSGSGT